MAPLPPGAAPLLSSKMKAFLDNVPPANAGNNDVNGGAVPVMLVHGSSNNDKLFNEEDGQGAAGTGTTGGGDDEFYDDIDMEYDDDNDDDEAAISPVSALFCSVGEFIVSLLFVPFWLKSLFGGVFFLRTIIFGFCVHAALQFQTATEHTLIKWLPTTTAYSYTATLDGTTGGSVIKGASSSPPRTLLALALLTIMALIVHPDGYTWIILRKLRDGIMFVLQSSSTCWAMAVNDYGMIVSTLLALSTFAALFLLAYVLHRTLSSRTPEGRRRQQNAVADKHRRKKRKQHAHHRGSKSSNSSSNSGGGRHALGRPVDPIPASTESDDILVVPNDNTKHDDDKILDEMHVHDLPTENATTIQVQGLPPLAIVPDEPMERVAVSVDKGIPLAANSLGESTVPSESPSVATSGMYDDDSCASGRSTPVPSVANELPESAVRDVVKLENRMKHQQHSGSEASRSKGKAPPSVVGVQTKMTNSNSRRQQNRKGKKSNIDPSGGQPPQQPQLPTPSKRWDALKPQNRASATNNRPARPAAAAPKQRPPARPDSTVTPRYETVDSNVVASLQCPVPQQTAAIEKQETSNKHSLPLHNAMTFASPPRTTASTSYSFSNENDQGRVSSNQRQPQLFEGTPNREYKSRKPDELAAGIVSTLNPHSPSWTSGVPSIPTAAPTYGFPIRPPPGLERAFQNDIPFGCGSSDGGSSAPASPFPSTPSILDLYPTDNTFSVGGNGSTASSPFHSAVSSVSAPEPDLLFLRNYQGLSLTPNDDNDADVSLSFRLNGHGASPSSPPMIRAAQNRQLRENPFAMSSTSDEEADMDQIEADLQALGGQMVGSVLDF